MIVIKVFGVQGPRGEQVLVDFLNKKVCGRIMRRVLWERGHTHSLHSFCQAYAHPFFIGVNQQANVLASCILQTLQPLVFPLRSIESRLGNYKKQFFKNLSFLN